eukprot:TRINITY_DN6638_c0_g1_i1.p1 TRINITY_DN6638_c0_g1~~TRINITY_DN6638_c0_g1_i1.p1  ORF type:complete len:824 (+),score=202.25 TRINITY_DN6638_c0_g1_i1:104-2473(+)
MAVSAVAATLSEARASLKRPSRPITATEKERRLFYGADYLSRPSTSEVPTFATPQSPSMTLSGGNAGDGGRPAKCSPSPPESARSAAAVVRHHRSHSREASSAAAAAAAASFTSPPRRRHHGTTESDVTPPSSPRVDAAETPPLSRGGRRAGEVASASPPRCRQGRSSSAGTGGSPTPVSTPRDSTPATTAQSDRAQWLQVKRMLPLLDPGGKPTELASTCRELTTVLSDNDCSFRQSQTAAHKQCVIRALGKLMNAKDPDLLVQLCKCHLLVTTSGAILTPVFKVLYFLSKDSANDERFAAENLIVHLLGFLAPTSRALQAEDVTGMLFASGALKHASANATVQKIILMQGTETLAELIKSDTLTTLTQLVPAETRDKKIAQLLVQITAVLRNISESAKTAKVVFVGPLLADLCALLGSHSQHSELAYNVSRILSKLSGIPECVQALSVNKSAIRDILQVMWKHPLHLPLQMRLCFTLGTLTANDDMCIHVVTFENNAVEPLISLLCKYSQIDEGGKKKDAAAKILRSSPTENFSEPDVEQALIKLIRLIANLAAIPDSAEKICCSSGIETLYHLLARKPIAKHEELVLNVIGALTNLSATADQHTNIILKHRIKIATILAPLVLHHNEEVVTESLRVFGNLSRFDDVSALIAAQRVDEAAVILLSHSNQEIVLQAAGIVMNLCNIARHHRAILDGRCPTTLVGVFLNTQLSDLELLTVVVKTLFNVCLQKELVKQLTPEHIEALKEHLTGLLVQAQTGGCDDFLQAAQRLLHHLDLPLYIPIAATKL